MRLPKFRYAMLAGAVAGAVIPLVLLGLCWLQIFTIAETWLLFIWPTSIMLS
jgi:hypothetical protein